MVLLIVGVSNVQGSISASYYHISQHSSAVILSQQQCAEMDYDDYGQMVSVAIKTSGNEPFGWQQEYRDSPVGLTYLRARYYRPMLKSFLTMDSYSLDNKYAYGNANPINFADPSGHVASWLNYALNGVGVVASAISLFFTCGQSAAITVPIYIGGASGLLGIGAQVLDDVGAVDTGEMLGWVSLGLAVASITANGIGIGKFLLRDSREELVNMANKDFSNGSLTKSVKTKDFSQGASTNDSHLNKNGNLKNSFGSSDSAYTYSTPKSKIK